MISHLNVSALILLESVKEIHDFSSKKPYRIMIESENDLDFIIEIKMYNKDDLK